MIKLSARLITATVALGLLATAARAGGSGDTERGTVTLARHFTTNALDGPVEIADWYTQLRGSLSHSLPQTLGTTRLHAEIDIKRFDAIDIEDDAALALGAETTLRLSPALELRGTLGMRLADEGDDIAVGDLIIGTRTQSAAVSAGLQAGLQIDPVTVLALEGSVSRELAARTRFEDGVAPPERLEPNRTRLRAGAALNRTEGPINFGIAVAGGLMRSDETPLLAGFDRLDAAARLLGAATFGDGLSLSAAFGVETVRVAGIFAATRPAYALSVSAPLGDAITLRASLKTGHDLASTDDPLVVWSRRLEMEAAYQLAPTLRFGVGAFDELRTFAAYGTSEDARGYYAEMVWNSREEVALILRVDTAKRRLMPLDLPRDVIEVKAAVTARL